MNKNINILFIFILLLLLVGSIFVLKRGHKIYPSAYPNKIILFTSQSCPHCQIVKKYLKDNQIKNKLPFTEKDVSQAQARNELIKYAQKCGLTTDHIGVPFIWNGQHCLIGDQKIINFFKQKINEK